MRFFQCLFAVGAMTALVAVCRDLILSQSFWDLAKDAGALIVFAFLSTIDDRNWKDYSAALKVEGNE
jgi:hypothetical protein